jgi:hypothetical protein
VPGMNSSFPDSCKCNLVDERCVGGIYALGCKEDLAQWFVTIESILGGVAIGVAVSSIIYRICDKYYKP